MIRRKLCFQCHAKIQRPFLGLMPARHSVMSARRWIQRDTRSSVHHEVMAEKAAQQRACGILISGIILR